MISKIEISHKTIIFTLVFLISIWLLFIIRDILFLLFISFILMASLRPMVERLEKYKIPRILSILFIYILTIGIFGVSLSSLVPLVITQTTKLLNNLPKIEAAISPYYQLDIKSLSQQIAPISQNIVKVSIGVFSNIVTVVTVLVFTFYLLLERKHLEDNLHFWFGKNFGIKLTGVIKSVELNLGSWMRGEFILMLFIGLLSYLGLTFLQIEYALPLAIIAGLLEIVPLIGPIVSAIPAVLVALTVSPFLGLAVAALYFIIQQLENNIIVPLVMKRTVGLSPIISILAIMIGSRLSGTIGIILSIPVVITIRAIMTSGVLDKD